MPVGPIRLSVQAFCRQHATQEKVILGEIRRQFRDSGRKFVCRLKVSPAHVDPGSSETAVRLERVFLLSESVVETGIIKVARPVVQIPQARQNPGVERILCSNL